MTKPKMSALVASAIRNLREIRGSTSKEIMSYIKSQYTGTDSSIQKQIYAALKRGLDYGILKRDRGYYSLNTDPEMMYKAHTVAPLEQGRRRRRRRRRGRGVSRRRGRGRRGRRRGRGRGRAARGRGRGRGRGRRRRRRRRSRSTRSRGSPPARTRSLAARCNKCSLRKRAEDTLRNSPVENLRKDMTYLYKSNQTPSRHQSRSRDRSQTRSRSSSSDKEMIDDRNRDQP
ncbi:octapeptide-repeat protein T2 [Solenopsis invicta]|uniref:octapeptide-repeat protein T2 n=1 Tax=Solenopsis invicta TaxID=13686 RepID=UPI0001FEAAFF|nr:octapeptide-repeat protein T2 [Solenopsis invicta]